MVIITNDWIIYTVAITLWRYPQFHLNLTIIRRRPAPQQVRQQVWDRLQGVMLLAKAPLLVAKILVGGEGTVSVFNTVSDTSL